MKQTKAQVRSDRNKTTAYPQPSTEPASVRNSTERQAPFFDAAPENDAADNFVISTKIRFTPNQHLRLNAAIAKINEHPKVAMSHAEFVTEAIIRAVNQQLFPGDYPLSEFEDAVYRTLGLLKMAASACDSIELSPKLDSIAGFGIWHLLTETSKALNNSFIRVHAFALGKAEPE